MKTRCLTVLIVVAFGIGAFQSVLATESSTETQEELQKALKKAQEEAREAREKALAQAKEALEKKLAQAKEAREKKLAQAKEAREKMLAEAKAMRSYKGMLTPEQKQKVFEYLKEVNPEELERIQALKPDSQDVKKLRKGPGRYEIDLHNHWREMQRLKKLKVKNPAGYELEIKMRDLKRDSQKLVKQYTNATGGKEREGIRSKLIAMTAQLFDLREVRRQEEVKKMKLKLEELRTTLTERQKNKKLIIERRVVELLGKSEALKW